MLLKFISTFLFRAFLILAVAAPTQFIPTQAEAGRLGVCYKCTYKVHGQTLEDYYWSGENTIGSNLDFTGRAKCGGTSPDSTERAPAQRCDNKMGIQRWTNNDPFDPACSNGARTHKLHIGGENMDLVVIVPEGRAFREGTFYRIQDGENMSCGHDVTGGADFSTFRYGVNRDLLDIFIVTDGKITRWSHRLQDGNHHQIVAGRNGVGRLYGRNKDVVHLYGILGSGELVDKQVRIGDGVNYAIRNTNGNIGVTYGRNHDVNGIFCFQNGAWVQGNSNRQGGWPTSC